MLKSLLWKLAISVLIFTVCILNSIIGYALIYWIAVPDKTHERQLDFVFNYSDRNNQTTAFGEAFVDFTDESFLPVCYIIIILDIQCSGLDCGTIV